MKLQTLKENEGDLNDLHAQKEQEILARVDVAVKLALQQLTRLYGMNNPGQAGEVLGDHLQWIDLTGEGE